MFPIPSCTEVINFLKWIKGRRLINKSKINNVKATPFVNIGKLYISARTGYTCFHIFNAVEFEGDFGKNPNVYLIFSEFGSKIQKNNLVHEIDESGIRVQKLNQIYRKGGKYKYELDEQNCYFSEKKDTYQLKPFILVVENGDVIGFTVLYYLNKTISTSDNSFNLTYMGKNPFFAQLLDSRSWPSKYELEKVVNFQKRRFALDSEEVNSILILKNEVLKSIKNSRARIVMENEYKDID